MDELLDQEGLDVDLANKIEQDTPLHKACEYARREKQHGLAVVEMLTEAGADPRYSNSAQTNLEFILCARLTYVITKG